jgi:hypothetical protein
MEKKIFDLHAENTELLKNLDFYKDEMKVIQKRIEEITTKNSSKEILMKVEHFQNQLIIQHNNLDELRHNVNSNELQIQKNINSNPTASDHRKMEDHVKEREDVVNFENHLNELRKELNEFLAKTL